MDTGQMKPVNDSIFNECDPYDDSKNSESGRYPLHSFKSYLLSSGQEVRWYRELDSTNKLASEIVRSGVRQETIIVTDSQSQGRGRFDRVWHSPDEKGLWFSIVLPYTSDISRAAQITLLTAVAVTEAVKRVTGVDAGIKWPNDLLVDSKKLCGILTEMVMDSDSDNVSLIVGIGLNVNMSLEDMTEEIQSKSTSLFIESGVEINRKLLLAEIMESFNSWLSIWTNDGFELIRNKWIAYNVTIGKELKVNSWDEYYCGRATGMDEYGSLEILDSNNNLQKLNSGEVSLIK